jgi:fructokinase
MSIDPNGPRCFCVRRGCVETYISGSGLEKIYAEQSLKLGKASDAREIFNLAKLGDRHARSSLEIFYFSFGRAFANLINILDPDIIILGGGLSNETTLYQEGIESIKNYVFNDELITPIVKHELGDSAGVIGAALIGV